MSEWLVVPVSIFALLFILRHIQTLEKKKPQTAISCLMLYAWMSVWGIIFATLACWIIYDTYTLVEAKTNWKNVYVFSGTAGCLLTLCLGYTYRYGFKRIARSILIQDK